VRLGIEVRSCFLTEIWAVTASIEYIESWVRNPAQIIFPAVVIHTTLTFKGKQPLLLSASPSESWRVRCLSEGGFGFQTQLQIKFTSMIAIP
jgi:hypothetical protein